MRRGIAVSALVVSLWAAAAAAADPAVGNWKLVNINNYQFDVAQFIIKLEHAEGKWSTDVVATGPNIRNFKVDSVKVANGQVRLAVLYGKAEYVFEGSIANPKLIVGNYGDDRRVNAAKLIWTEEEKLDQRTSITRKKLPESMQELEKLQAAVNQTANKLRQAEKDEDKKPLREELAEKRKALDAATPGLLKATLTKYADDPAAMDAAILLIRGAGKNGATLDDVKKWAAFVLKKSEGYGPRFRRETQINLAEMLVGNAALASLAAEYAKKAESDLGSQASTARQVRVLTTLVKALGQSPDAKPYLARLDRLERVLDDEYLAKHAKLAVEPFAGRKNGGNRTVLLELFTGAQCGPCVAADIAFDKLCEAYQPTDLVLLQYHLHIPGPDPLTNSDSEMRWKYYLEAFPKEVGGVPASIFNGQPDSRGGGPEDAAMSKLKEFRSIIDPLLEDDSKVKLTVRARKAGDVVNIQVSAADLPDSQDGIKLRMALVEENIRYAGSNGIRFHHHVVRAMPGGPEGRPVSGSDRNWQESVNLTELRSQLTKYLDQFVERNGPFPKPNRPMDFKKLKAVVWLQNDSADNRPVLQAAMVDVEGDPAK